MKKHGIKVALFFALIGFLFTSCAQFWNDVLYGIMCPINSIYLYDKADYDRVLDADDPLEFNVGDDDIEVCYEIEYSASTTKELTFKLRSSDESVAVPVDSEIKTSLTTGSFKIRAVGKGDCQITMFVDKYDGKIPGYDVVYVKVNPKPVRIMDSNGNHINELTLYKGDSMYLYAENTYDNRSVRWNTSNGYNLKITEQGDKRLQCRIDALQKSEREIITLSSFDGKKNDYCYVTIADPQGWKVTVTNTSSIPAEIYPQDKFTLRCSVSVDSGISDDVYWESDNKAVAVVNSRGEVTAVSAGTANIYAVLSENASVKSPAVQIKVLAPPVKADQFFWGKWTRMDKGWNYEVEETAVIVNGQSHKIQSSTSEKLIVNGVGEFTKVSNSQINLHDDIYDIDIPFYRQGGTNLSYKVKVVGFKDVISGNDVNASSRAVSTDDPVEETITVKKGLKVKSQSEKYSSYQDSGETDEEGYVTLTAPVQGDSQTLTIEDEETKDIIVVSGLKIDNDGANMGTIPLVGKDDYSLKVTGTIPEESKNSGYLYGNNYKTYPLTLTITNISDIKSATSSCNIYTKDPKLNISLINSVFDIENVAIPTMKSGATMTIQLNVSYADLIENYEDTEILIEIKNMKTKRVWFDYVPLRFFAGQMPITITTTNINLNKESSLNGFLIYPDGNSKFFAVPEGEQKTLYIPVFGTKKDSYKMVFSGATVSGNLSETTAMCYKVLFNTETGVLPNLKNWDQMYDFGENNDEEDKATLIENDFEAYLEEGDIDFYKINVKSDSKTVYEK